MIWIQKDKILQGPSSSLLKDLHEVLLKLWWSSCEFRPCSEVYEWAEPVWLLSLCPLWASSAILAAHRPDALIMTEKGPASETAKQHGYKQTDRQTDHTFAMCSLCYWWTRHVTGSFLTLSVKAWARDSSSSLSALLSANSSCRRDSSALSPALSSCQPINSSDSIASHQLWKIKTFI